ncbi:MAG: tetratricopeptide repeat protein [Alphaproteobacteria bacterium]
MRLLIVGVLFTLGAAPALGNQIETQNQFLQAINLLEQGRAEEAAELLNVLYLESPTPRIRLELARALMLSGNLREAKRLFVEAYKNNPPPAVRANILSFIDRIDQQRGKLSVKLSVSRFGNPLNQPGNYNLNFGGIDMSYVPDSEYQNVWGTTVGAQYQKRFQSGIILLANVSYRSLPNDAADRFAGEVAASKQLTPLVELRGGVVRLGQKHHSFTMPYAQVTYTKGLGSRTAVQPSVRVGYYDSEAGQSVSGWQADAFVPFVLSPNPAQAFAIGPTFLRHSVGFSEQSYSTIGLRGIAAVRLNVINAEFGLQLRTTRFDAVDPFWGKRRTEKGAFGSLVLSSDRLRIGSIQPAVGFSCDVTRSTIQYYRQGTCDALVDAKLLF